METEVEPIFTIESRYSLPGILNSIGLTNEGVEVGVQEGYFSSYILAQWDGKKLYSVDPWAEFSSDANYVDIANIAQENQEIVYNKARELLKRFGDRSQIIRKTSKDSAPMFEDNSMDFVYIDAQHHYEAVAEDIELWWPKVKTMGILSGHDYIPDGHYRMGIFGVKRAVNEFVTKNKLELIIASDDPPQGSPPNAIATPSWFIIKKS